MMNRLVFLVKIFKNKYTVSLLVFIVWIVFFDRNDVITQMGRKKELLKLESSAAFYESEIANTKKDLLNLNNKPAILEKFAREKYYLKRPNEDVFLVSDSTDNKN